MIIISLSAIVRKEIVNRPRQPGQPRMFRQIQGETDKNCGTFESH